MVPVMESCDWEARATKGEEEGERERRRKAVGAEKKDMAKQACGVEAVISGMEAETVQVYHEAQTVLAPGRATTATRTSRPGARSARLSAGSTERAWLSVFGRVWDVSGPCMLQKHGAASHGDESIHAAWPTSCIYVLHYAWVHGDSNPAMYLRIYRCSVLTTPPSSTIAAPHMQDRPPPLRTSGRAHRPFV